MAAPATGAARAGAGCSPPGCTAVPTPSTTSASWSARKPTPALTTPGGSCSMCTGRWFSSRPTCSSGMSSADRSADQPFPFAPARYRDDRGRQDGDLDRLLGSQPRYSLASLAAYFTGPALYRDFRPECPWAGITVVRPQPPRPGQGPAGRDDALRAAFDEAVRAAIGEQACVAVAFSGGMDSAAVLWAAWQRCREDGRRLVAVTLAQRDDEGRRTGEVAASVAAALGADCEHVVVGDQP